LPNFLFSRFSPFGVLAALQAEIIGGGIEIQHKSA
jgi:hypothetical protein